MKLFSEKKRLPPRYRATRSPMVGIGAIMCMALLLVSSNANAERVFIISTDASKGKQTDEKTTLVIDLVAEGVAKRGHTILSASDVKETLTLQHDRQALGCEDDAACVAALTAATQADWLLTAQLGQVGNDVVLSLSLLDTSKASVTGRQSAPVISGGAAIDVQKTVDDLLNALFGASQNKAAFQLPAGDMSFAVLDLTSAGVDASIAQNLTQVLSAELKKVEGASVIGRDDIAALLQYEGDRQTVGCEDDSSCLAELGDALGVERIVVGQVGRVVGSFVISLRLIRTADVMVESRVTETFRGEEEQLIGAVRHALRKLIGVKADGHGAIFVSCSEEAARLFVDGQEQGALPRAPVGNLKPGRHEVRVQKDGYYDFRGEVYVGPGDTVNQWVQLEERPAAFYQTWPFWAVVGSAGAAVFAVTATLTAGGIGVASYEYLRPRPIGPVSATLPVRE